MTKAELTERIIDRITDPYTDDEEAIAMTGFIDINEATEYLKEYHNEDNLCELDPEDRMPDEVTPELLMEVYNCYVRKAMHDVRIKRLAEYITEREDVCLHDNCFGNYANTDPEVLPVEFLSGRFPFTTSDGEQPDAKELIMIGQNSHDFNPGHEYCWFNASEEALHSSDTPFADGILNATALATYLIEEDRDMLEYVIDDMEDNEVQHIFGCTREEV